MKGTKPSYSTYKAVIIRPFCIKHGLEMRQKIDSIQVFRGIAALAVVGHHAVQSTGAFIGEMPSWIHNTIGRGLYGVDFFFVLSGFIIMFIHQHDNKTLSNAKHYAAKRFMRVFPVYWCVAIPLAIAYYVMSGLSASGGREISFLSSAFLLPSSGVPTLSVAWTLIHEVMFYAFFLVFFYSTRVFTVFIIAWLGTILMVNIFGDAPTGASRYVFSLLNIEFILGMLAAKALKFIPNSKIAGGLVISGVILGTASIYAINIGLPGALRLIFALGMAMLIIGAATLERFHQFSWPYLLILLGNASYSIYLIHNPALSITQRVLGKMDTGWALGLVAGIVLTTIAGVIFHLIVEKAIVNMGQRVIRSKPKPSLQGN